MASFIKQISNAVKHWYIPLIIGLIFIGVAIWTFTSPIKSYLALSIVFSISFIVSGVSEIFFAFANKDQMDNWGWLLVFGIFTLLVGLLLIFNPEISMTTLPFYVGFVVLFRSISSISMAFDLRSYGVLDWGYLMAIGILGVIFSFILLWNPIFAGMTIVFWTGMTFLLIGILSVFFSFKLRKLHNLPGKVSDELMSRYIQIQDEIEKELRTN